MGSACSTICSKEVDDDTGLGDDWLLSALAAAAEDTRPGEADEKTQPKSTRAEKKEKKNKKHAAPKPPAEPWGVLSCAVGEGRAAAAGLVLMCFAARELLSGGHVSAPKRALALGALAAAAVAEGPALDRLQARVGRARLQAAAVTLSVLAARALLLQRSRGRFACCGALAAAYLARAAAAGGALQNAGKAPVASSEVEASKSEVEPEVEPEIEPEVEASKLHIDAARLVDMRERARRAAAVKQS